MKLLLIILAIYTSVYGNNSSSYSNSYNSYSSVPVEQAYRGIGYTTNYSNGQFNSGVYKSSMTTLEYQNRAFTGTYNPSSGSSDGSRPGGGPGPRRVKGYDNNGNEIGDGSPETGYSWRHGNWNFWDDEDDYDYYWDETSKTWWRKKKGSTNWEKWNEHTGHFIIDWWDYWDWDNNGKSGPTNPYVRGYHESPTPIGDATVPLLSLLLLYVGYDILIRPRLKK